MPFSGKVAERGESVTEVTGNPVGGGGVAPAITVTMAEPSLVGSALLVAVTVAVSGFDGAEYTPLAVIVPADAAQVTESLVVEPSTLARNVSLLPVVIVTEDGETVTRFTSGAVGAAFP